MPIKYNYEVSVNDNKAKLNKDIFLFRGNRNIHYYFSIKGARFTFSKENEDLLESSNAIYAAVTVVKPNGVEVANAIAPVEDGLIHLKVTEDLIDEEVEVGDFDLVFDLFDDNEGAVTIPKIKGQFHVQERPCTTSIGTLSGNVNVVNQAVVDLAIATQENEQLIVVDDDGKYVKTTWVKGDKISIERLNKIEEGIEKNSTQYKDIANQIKNGNIGNSVEPALMDMPRLYFSEGTLPTTKTATTLKFDYYSKTTEYHGWAEIKCQGNSSMGYAKKNFTIKLYKDQAKTEKLKIDFKGWGKQSKFVLKANWIDITHARNVVSARIWADIVKSRSSYLNLPELLRTSPNQGAVDGFPVTVYGNGYYQGRYTLNIPKDKWMSNMDDSLDTHCILCGENYVSGCFRATANINGSDWTDELHDTVPASIKTRWNQCISFVMNSTDEEFKANLHNYFDVDSLIDYLLYGIESCGFDAFGKNQLYFTYDGQKWIASMYDMDSTWGLWWNGSKFVATDYPRESFEDYTATSSNKGNLLYIRLQQLFINEIKSRYAELRRTIFTYPYLVNKFEEFIQICPQDIVKEDYASTTANGAYTGIPSKSTNNIQQLRSYIDARLIYVDSYINSLVEPIPCTGITLNTNDIVFENTTTPITLTATLTPTNTTDSVVWSVSPTGICTVNNGVVTPVSNGSCVITATCGNQSVSCNVTVNLPVVAVTGLSLDKDSISLGTAKEIDDSGVNYLAGATWKNGQYKVEGFKPDGVNKVTSVTVPYPGTYQLSYTGSLNLAYKGFGPIDSTGKINGLFMENTKHIVFKPNTLLGITFYPNGNVISDTEYNKFELKRVQSINSIAKDIEVSLDVCGKPVWATTTDINIIEFKGADFIDCSNIFAIQVGDTVLNYPYNYIKNTPNYSSNEDFKNINSLNGFNTDGINVALPLSVDTYGTTLSDFKTYMTNNNKKIIINPSDYINTLETTYSKFQDTLTATLTPSNATNQNVVWTADNENVELVTDGLNCTVKAKTIGSSVVTCTSSDTTNGTISDTCTVTVTDVPTE